MFVEHISVAEFKDKLDEIYRSTESPSQYNAIHDNIKDIILNDRIPEDEVRMRKKDLWKDQQTYDRSFSCPAVLEHDNFPEEVHARIAPNVFDKDELTLAQAQKSELKFEWPLLIEAIRKELTSLIIDNEVFESVK